MILVPVWSMAALSGTMAAKHYLADFVLQSAWMARGKERRQGWLVPLAAHAGIHGLATLGVALVVAPHLWWLGLVDVAIHFTIDKAKAMVGCSVGFVPAQAGFWWLMGFDQFLHALTDLGLVSAMLVL